MFDQPPTGCQKNYNVLCVFLCGCVQPRRGSIHYNYVFLTTGGSIFLFTPPPGHHARRLVESPHRTCMNEDVLVLCRATGGTYREHKTVQSRCYHDRWESKRITPHRWGVKSGAVVSTVAYVTHRSGGIVSSQISVVPILNKVGKLRALHVHFSYLTCNLYCCTMSSRCKKELRSASACLRLLFSAISAAASSIVVPALFALRAHDRCFLFLLRGHGVLLLSSSAGTFF